MYTDIYNEYLFFNKIIIIIKINPPTNEKNFIVMFIFLPQITARQYCLKNFLILLY